MDVFNQKDLDLSKVSIRRGKGYTALSTPCNVRGALVFMRARRSGPMFWLARALGLQQASRFRDDIDVYGADNVTLARLQADPEFGSAVATLFENKASRVTLGGNRLRAQFPGRQPEAREEASRAALRFVSRLEQLNPVEINAETSLSWLVTPLVVFCAVGYAAFFGAGILTNDVRLITPLGFAPVTVGIAVAIVGGVLLVASPFLKRQALAAAALPQIVTALLIGAIFGSVALSEIADVRLGRQLMTDQLLVVSAMPAQSSAKGHPCFMEFERATDVLGQTRTSLPISCKGFNKLRAGGTGYELYRIEVNPGYFQGGLFVDSIERAPGAMSSNHSGALASFADAVRARIHQNMTVMPNPHDLETVIEIRCTPDGTLLSATINRSSGDTAIDDAALQSVRRSDPLPATPVGADGKPLTRFLVTLRP
jgi:TonB family protein